MDKYDTKEMDALRRRARDRVREFSDENFRDNFKRHLYKHAL